MRCQYCYKKATALIRTCDVCNEHFNLFKKDNQRRINTEIKPKDCSWVKKEKKFIIKHKLNRIPKTLILLDDEVRFLRKKERVSRRLWKNRK